jgi:hypothetical protein
MTIAIDGRGWRCWRNPDEHKGRSPVYLISALLSCGREEAAAIAGVRQALDHENFAETIAAMLSPPKVEVSDPNRGIKLMPSFKPFTRTPPPLFVKYLASRGYTDLPELTTEWDLHFCTTGDFKGRVIFPVIEGGKVKTWTGRSIFKDAHLRYKALTPDEQKAKERGWPLAVGPISNYLLWYDVLMAGGDTLFICEGPFDALKLNTLGVELGVRATPYFGIRPSKQQINLLHEIRPRFRRGVIVGDSGAEVQAMRTHGELAALGFYMAILPPGVKDPGKLTHRTFGKLLSGLAPS